MFAGPPMRQTLTLIDAAVALALLAATPAAAQQEQELPSEWTLCLNAGNVYPPDIVADGCTAVISSRDHNPRELAVAFTNRGLAYRAQGDFDRAIADYDAAIKLDPGYAVAFNNRGAARRDQGEYDRAIADYTEALRFDPRNAAIFTNRGAAYGDKGDFNRAIADYDEALR